MKRSRFTDEQIIGVLKKHEAGELCRRHGISEATLYAWKSRYGGMDVSEAKRLRGLEDENAKLKRLLADAMLDNAALKDLLGNNGSARCEARGCRASSSGVRDERAAGVPGGQREPDDGRYRSARPPDDQPRARLKALAHERRRFGYRRLHVLLRREGYALNHKRLFRLYREERLAVRKRGGRKRAVGTRAPLAVPLRPNERWSLDYVSDQLACAGACAS